MYKFSVSYTNGFKVTQNTLKNILDLIQDSNSIINDLRIALSKHLAENLKDYETIGRTIDFRTQSGIIIQLKRITYGTTVDVMAEADAILGILDKNLKVGDRVPIMRFVESDYIGDALIEIDKTNGIMYHRYKNRISMEIPILYGIKNETPLEDGVYYIVNKHEEKRAYLGNLTLDKNLHKIRLGLNLEGAGIQNLGYVDNHGSLSIDSKLAERLYDVVNVKTPVFIY